MRSLILTAVLCWLAGCSPGPQGPAGAPGPAGPQGPAGPTGAQGPPLVLVTGGGLSGSGTSASPLAVTSGGITADHLAGPARLYSRLMTPRWLQTNADFHNARPVNVTDTEVSFAAAGAGNASARLLTVPLLPASTLKTNETYLVRLVVNQVVASRENDPTFGITDGTEFVGIVKSDADNAHHSVATLAAYGNNLTSIVSTALGNVGQNAQNFEFLFRLGPVVGGNTPVFFASRVGELAGRHQANSRIDRTRTLSFVVFGDEDVELYTFQSFEVTIDREG